MINATSALALRAKKTYPASVIIAKAIAEGIREAYSVTPPVSVEIKATHQ